MPGQLVDRDVEHLQMLSIFYFVLGGMGMLFSLIPCIHLTVGITMIVLGDDFANMSQQAATGNANQVVEPPFEVIGWLIVTVATAIICLGLTISTAMIFAGKKLRRREGYIFCLIVAGIVCLWVPMGTVLGVFSFIVLLRPSVRVLFGVDPPPDDTAVEPLSNPPSP